LIALRSVDPDTMTALSCGDSAGVAAQILAGEAEIGFGERPKVPGGVQAREVARDEPAVVVPSHTLCSARAVTAELAAGTLVRPAVPGLDLTRRMHAIRPAGNAVKGPASDFSAIALRSVVA
jgi:DNA-binding transcriptional LysR family regulator